MTTNVPKAPSPPTSPQTSRDDKSLVDAPTTPQRKPDDLNLANPKVETLKPTAKP